MLIQKVVKVILEFWLLNMFHFQSRMVRKATPMSQGLQDQAFGKYAVNEAFINKDDCYI